MFSRFGRFAHKYKYFILAGWVILTAIFVITAPSLSEVGVTDQSQFLPENSPSATVRELLDTKFGTISDTTSSALIVVYNENGLNQQDMDRALAVRDWLVSPGAPEAIASVVSVFDDEALRASLVSADNTTMMMSVGFSVNAISDAAKQAVSDIRAQFALQQGTSFYLTGDVGFLNDLFASVQDTIDRSLLGKFNASEILSDLLEMGLIEVVGIHTPSLVKKVSKIDLREVSIFVYYGVFLAIIFLVFFYFKPDILSYFMNSKIERVNIELPTQFVQRNQLDRIGNALELYYMEKGEYPYRLEDLVSVQLLRKSDLFYQKGVSYQYELKNGKYYLKH